MITFREGALLRSPFREKGLSAKAATTPGKRMKIDSVKGLKMSIVPGANRKTEFLLLRVIVTGFCSQPSFV